MKLSAHFLMSSLLALALYPFFGFNALWVYSTGFLIDLDHYLYYIFKFKFKRFNPFKVNRYFVESHLSNVMCIFHTVEVFLLVVVLAIFTFIGKLMLFSLVIHHLMDFYNEERLGRGNAKAKSLISYMFGSKK